MTKATTQIPNREIVVYALHLLGGATKRVHTEDITLMCFRLSPSAFSWAKHTNYPDKDIVRVALTDAHKERYGGLVDGRTGQRRGQFQMKQRAPSEDGWSLTDAGVAWLEENRERLAQLGGEEPREHRQKIQKVLARVRCHNVFMSFVQFPDKFDPSIGDLADLLRCRVDADKGIWMDRFERIRKNAVAAGDNQVSGFVDLAIGAYKKRR